MDESWRIGAGLMRGLSRRQSVEDQSSSRMCQSIFSGNSVDANDFADVFGGPPKTLLAHKFHSSGTFYDDIFRSPEFMSPAPKSDRNLPVFRIPAKNEGFYSDIFGSDDDRKSRERSGSQSKANSSSVLSSEELSPSQQLAGDDVALSDFASNLRPINVPWRWNSSTMMPEEHADKQRVPLFQCNTNSFDNFRSSNSGFSKRVSSPETISLESNSYRSIEVFTDEWEPSSPFSVVSSLCQEPEAKSLVHDHVLPEQTIEHDDEVMNSYVIDISSNLIKEDCDTSSSAIDEAIAWAKEKFQSRGFDEGSSMRNDGNEHEIEGSLDASEYHDDGIGIVQPQKTEREKLDRDIRLWSSGKETNIRLLLSTMHNVLWPESGWYAIPVMSLTESSQVKKAYQKARLFLHPYKLQHRGVTLLQNYAAEKAFSILQDAWAAFIFEDVSFQPEDESNS
ncbi:hypothetical protein TanjilG_09122 [Lupinus angustifolius]|uniref:J domain-containing protein n=1 Tax=Lupinus angustifolius TaxID=3871 RepID=A0A4P1R3V3_LUPAN|nr:PREDICTED: auxilin-related protein 1-like isoform X2 [Lupinus angustifolius]OIW00641.1 hypothetical protein TanjilG_09122 [Lupinus angustifolius]